MSDRDRHKATSYSGKKPYLTHNYRTMMKRKTQEEYYFHELHQDPMSNLLRPYLDDPEIKGFNWEYMAPNWGWGWPPWNYPGPGPGGGGTGPYDDDDGIGPGEGCTECQVVGPASIECGNAWIGQVIPSQCAGFIQFAIGLEDQEGYETVGNSAGTLVVAVPAGTGNSSMLVCNSGGPDFPTCCMEVSIECCCEFSLEGAATVNAGNTWVGTVSPACPGAECVAISNSGCTFTCSINEGGSQVTVGVGGGDCGGFTVTVTDPSEGCSGNASKFVRINGGAWELDQSSSALGMSGCVSGCQCGGGIQTWFNDPCEIGEYQYGGFDPVDDDCTGTVTRQCRGTASGGCDPCGGADGVNICGWAASPCLPDGADCMRWSWWRCKWECEC